ncbi:STAS/SEC14 domain-containing protein [Sphingomonas crocodyli]|uniref:STAS/SEC14 domain-containing protein n=1 Tax=Sphingomonas crocodyli TaxID=1979270 RepID=A0A437M701_9SPHN|nr:STAS/SEC14 domain-containing protein [Sphingomonas crocodyli]RVT93501.1 STAS/SEC14 domain-containing protein [Sphingomonas crocodyli]
MYTIQFNRAWNLLDISWSGLFTPDEMRRYAADCEACRRRERIEPGYRLRIVLTDNQPLPQDTLGVLGKVFENFPVSSRTAMVTKSAVARMQIRRTMMVPQMQIFDDPTAALAWLMAPQAREGGV